MKKPNRVPDFSIDDYWCFYFDEMIQTTFPGGIFKLKWENNELFWQNVDKPHWYSYSQTFLNNGNQIILAYKQWISKQFLKEDK